MATQNPRSSNPASVAALEPEAVVEQLRATRAQIAEVTPVTSSERRLLRRRAQTSNPVLQASINVIGAHDQVSLAVAQPAQTSRGASASRSSPGRPTTSVRSWRATRPMPAAAACEGSSG